MGLWFLIAQSGKNAQKPADEGISANSTPAPESVAGLIRRANLHRKSKNFLAALSDLEEAGRRDPSDIEAASLIFLVKIENGQIGEVRSLVLSYEQLGVSRHSQLWLLGAAAAALKDGNPERAARAISGFKQAAPPDVSNKLLADPFFIPYRENPAIRPFYPDPKPLP